MKKFIVFFGALLICGVAAAQEKIDFYKFIESIDWNSTREQVIDKYKDIIMPDSLVDAFALAFIGSKPEKDEIFIPYELHN